MIVARYLATLGVQINNQDQKKVDTFLGNIEKGLKGNVKGTNDLEKAVKKETKTTVDGAKSKVSAQKAVNKETAAAVVVTNKLTQAVTKQQTVVRRNAESINKLFPAMWRSPLPARSRDRADAVSIYKDMFKAADVRIKDLNKLANKVREEGNLLGRIGRNSPHFANLPNMGKMREVSALGRIGKNAQAFSSYGRVGNYQSSKAQRVSGEVSALGRIGRNASTYGAPSRGSLQERLAAFRSNRVEGVQVQNQVEASERRILDLKRREDSRRLTHQQTVERMALRHEHNLAEIREKNAVKLSRVAKPRGVSSGGLDSGTVVAAGGVGGIAARAYMPALALAGGGYGAGWLNRRNQEVVSAQLMMQAVVQQAGGTAQEGTQSFDWLRGQADRVGFNYLEAAPDFTKLISGLTGAGMSVGTSQETFKGFAELSRVNKLDKTSQNRLFRALSQVAGKNQLMSEELTGQIAEALPGGVALFAEAWQRKTGGNLKGSDSIKALREAMEKKQVKGDILPIAALIASEKAASGLSAASQASQAEQSRMKNALNDQAIIASQNGIESGFAKIFRAAAIGLSESNNLTKSLAQSFDVAATFAEKLILFPQSFARALDGRDSLVAEWLGVGATEDLREDWATIKALIDNIFSMEVPSWMVTFESTAKEIAMLLGKLAEFQQFQQRTSTAAEQIIADEYYAGGGSVQSQIKGIAKANWHTFKNVFTGSSDDSAQYLAQRDAYNGMDISPYMDERGFNPMSYWKGQEQRSRDYAMDAFGEGGLAISPKTAGTYIAESRNENRIDVNIVLQGGDTEETRSYFRNEFRTELDTALLNFGQTE